MDNQVTIYLNTPQKYESVQQGSKWITSLFHFSTIDYLFIKWITSYFRYESNDLAFKFKF